MNVAKHDERSASAADPGYRVDAPVAAPEDQRHVATRAAPPQLVHGPLEQQLRSRRMVVVPSGVFWMGGEKQLGFPADGELPTHKVKLEQFALDTCATTNRDFAAFVQATGYRTDAERAGWSFVFHLLAPHGAGATRARTGQAWWRQIEDAMWRTPEGRASHIEERLDHPVVHVSWNDAQAFARWAGKRLPSEAEWEYAARGGLRHARYPWGNKLTPRGKHCCNIWQGEFPERNTADDGYVGTAPVNTYSRNRFGLYNMAGNVWEWCEDWFDATYYERSPYFDPRGPSAGAERVMRGGSYLCCTPHCSRYRVGARSKSTPESTFGNLGFRCAADVSEAAITIEMKRPGARRPRR